MMDTTDIQELILRIQGRSENYDSVHDPVLYKEWTNGTNVELVAAFNDYIDTLYYDSSSGLPLTEIPHFIFHANVDGAHIMILNTVFSYGNKGWTQIALGAEYSNGKLRAGSRIMIRKHYNSAWSSWTDYVTQVDEEDLTIDMASGLIKFANKEYTIANNSGLGRIYVRKGDNLKTLLENKTNTRFIIQYNHSISQIIQINANNTLVFEGGSITGSGTLVGNNTVIEATPVAIFGTITLEGTWKASDYYCEWFGGNIIKTLNTFHSIKFVGEYVVSSQIWINDFAKVEFGTNCKITVDPYFNYDYLFGVQITKSETGYKPQQHDALRFVGSGLVDLSGKCGFAIIYKGTLPDTTYFHYNIDFTGLRVIKAAKNKTNPSQVQAIVANMMQEAHFSNCWFSDANNVGETLKHNYGIYCPAGDCKFDRVTVICRNTCFYLGGSSMLSNVHAWGWPEIAFEIAGQNCFFSEVYADCATEAFHFHSGIQDIQISQFSTIRPSANSNINKTHMYLIVTEGTIPLQGIAYGYIDKEENQDKKGIIHYPVHLLSVGPTGNKTYSPLSCPKLLFINTSDGFLPNVFSTADRPSSNLPDGYNYFDTSLHKPLWWYNGNWYDACGIQQ